MSGTSQKTSDHETIKKWVEERGGCPATVKDTGKGDAPGVLRVDFPGYGDEDSLEQISWDDFFEKFDKEGLAFLYQDSTSSGETSRFFKLVQGDED